MISKYAALVKQIDIMVSSERAVKCGYDLLNGIEAGDVEKRAKAWRRYLEEVKNNEGHTDSERDGVWVPAIPLEIS